MKTVLVCAILGAVVFPCMAAETFIDTYNFGKKGILWNSESESWKDYSSISWAHHMDRPTSCTRISQAMLTFKGHDIDNVWQDRDRDGGYEQMDFAKATFRGHTLGKRRRRTVTFNLPPFLITDSVGANPGGFPPNNRYDFDWHKAVRPGEPILSGTYPGTIPPVAVPAPGALVLAGIGTILVGTLRRRKAI